MGKRAKTAYAELPQESVGDPTKFQALLAAERVPVPPHLTPQSQEMGKEDIPVGRYISRDFHRLEADRLWPHVWQFVAREEQLPKVGDYLVYDLIDRSLLIVRGEDGALRGFYNSCLHRGRALRTSNGTASQIKCPFHGFTWDLQGGFRSMPCAWDFKHLDAGALHLPQVRVDSWGGFVFVNFSESGPSLQEYLEVLPEHFSAYMLDRSCTLAHVQKVIPCNWKVGQEAFFESMHVRVTHPHILTFIGDVDSQYDILGEHVSRMITPSTVHSPNIAGVSEEQVLRDSLEASGRMADSKGEGHVLPPGMTAREYIGELNRKAFAEATGADLTQATLAELQDAILYSIFPNTQIWAGYFGNIVYRFIPNGDDHESCIFDVRLLGRYPEGAQCPPAPPVHRLGIDEPFSSAPELGALGPVFDQDMGNLPHMMKGLKASGKGTISLAQYQESRIRHHHRTLDSYLGLGDRS